MQARFSYVLLLSIPSVMVSLCSLAAPSLKIDPPAYEWGRQVENKGTYPFSFTLTNEGDELLRIENVRAGCSCTVVEVAKRELKPGESMAMPGVLTTKGVEGKMSKGIIISTNDPLRKTSVARLTIGFPYSAEGLRIGSARYAARLRKDQLYAYVSVENCEPETAYRIVGAELPDGWSISRSLPLPIEPESRQTVVLQCPVPEGFEPEPFDQLFFTLISDCPKTPEIKGSLLYRPPRPIPVVPVEPQHDGADPAGGAAAPAAK